MRCEDELIKILKDEYGIENPWQLDSALIASFPMDISIFTARNQERKKAKWESQAKKQSPKL